MVKINDNYVVIVEICTIAVKAVVLAKGNKQKVLISPNCNQIMRVGVYVTESTYFR